MTLIGVVQIEKRLIRNWKTTQRLEECLGVIPTSTASFRHESVNN